MPLIDLSHAFSAHMPVYPGDPTPELKPIASLETDGFCDHLLSTPLHVGTHMDAPRHMLRDGKDLSEFDVSRFVGRGVLLDCGGKSVIDADVLDGVRVEKGDVVLVWTCFDAKYRTPAYFSDFPLMTEAFANELVESGASIVGMDTPSPDRAPYQVHKILLAKPVLIIENLTHLEKLAGVDSFEVFALPMKLEADAAPARVVARW